MRHFKIALVFSLAVVLPGCVRFGQAQREKPPWVSMPEAAEESSKFISAVGMAAAGPSKEARLAVAEQEARAELARAVTDYVQHVLETFLQTHANFADPASTAAQEFTTAVSTEVPNALLRQSLHSDAWEDASAGTVYVLYRIPISMVNDRIGEKVTLTLRTVNPFPQGREGEVTDALRQFLNAQLKERVALAARREEPEAATARSLLSPAWLAFGRHDDYPSAKFMTAIGLGDDRLAAERSARVELASQVEVNAVNRLLSSAGTAGELGANLKAVRQEQFHFSETDLVAVQIVETWYDHVTDTYYAFGVVDRQMAGDLHGTQVRAAFKQGEELFQSARNHQKAGNHERALQEYAQALARMRGAVKFQLAAMVVDPARADEFLALARGVTPLQEIKNKMAEVLAAFSLLADSGDGQWTPPGVPLRKPLVVKVVAGREARPLPDIPVRFRFVGGKGELQQLAKTAADGRASCEVQRVDAAAETVGAIQCGVALDELAAGADFSGITPPSLTFKYVLRTRENTQFAVYVDERTLSDKVTVGHLVRDAVCASLAEAQFGVVDDAKLPARVVKLTGDSAEADVLAAFASLNEDLAGKGFLLIVVGDVRCRLVETTKTSRGDLHYVEARAVLRVIDPALSPQATVLVLTASRPEARTGDPEEAAWGAREKVAKLTAQKLTDALKERFGAR